MISCIKFCDNKFRPTSLMFRSETWENDNSNYMLQIKLNQKIYHTAKRYWTLILLMTQPFPLVNKSLFCEHFRMFYIASSVKVSDRKSKFRTIVSQSVTPVRIKVSAKDMSDQSTCSYQLTGIIKQV